MSDRERSASREAGNEETRSDARRSSRSGSRSRSPSRSRDHSSKKRYSRSRSRSPRRSRHRPSRGRSRSRSRSPISSRKRPVTDRGRRQDWGQRPSTHRADFQEAPPPSRCLGVFGLSLYTTERDLKDYFSKFGRIDNVQLVYDHPTGRSRGFGFIYFDNIDDAINAKEQAAGLELDGHRVRVDFSITKRAHTPTPGIYMGKPSQRSRRYDDNYSRGRSPSPHHRGSRRSRSYSYSPRREYR